MGTVKKNWKEDVNINYSFTEKILHSRHNNFNSKVNGSMRKLGKSERAWKKTANHEKFRSKTRHFSAALLFPTSCIFLVKHFVSRYVTFCILFEYKKTKRLREEKKKFKKNVCDGYKMKILFLTNNLRVKRQWWLWLVSVFHYEKFSFLFVMKSTTQSRIYEEDLYVNWVTLYSCSVQIS